MQIHAQMLVPVWYRIGMVVLEKYSFGNLMFGKEWTANQSHHHHGSNAF